MAIDDRPRTTSTCMELVTITVGQRLEAVAPPSVLVTSPCEVQPTWEGRAMPQCAVTARWEDLRLREIPPPLTVRCAGSLLVVAGNRACFLVKPAVEERTIWGPAGGAGAKYPVYAGLIVMS